MENKTDITLCPLCKEVYIDPRILPCIHTFCLKCIEKQHGERSDTDLSDSDLLCPVCCRNFVLPGGKFENLPRNFFLEKLIKINRISNPSYVIHDVPCDECRCDLDGEGDSECLSNIRAAGFCVECDEHLCEQCCMSHSRTKFTKFHRVILLGVGGTDHGIQNSGCVSGDAPTSRPCVGSSRHSTCVVSATGECDLHKNEILKMFCSTCEKAICFLCYAEQHTGHKCSDITKIAETYTHAIVHDKQDAVVVLTEVQTERDRLDQKRDVFITEIDQLQTAVKQKATKLKFLIEMHCNELIENLEEIKEIGLIKYRDKRSELDSCSSLTEGFRHYATELLDKGNLYDIIQNSRDFHLRIKELRHMHFGIQNNPFKFNKTIYMPYNVQQLLMNEKISNLIGSVHSKEHSVTASVPSIDLKSVLAAQTASSSSVHITAKGSLVLRDCSDNGTCITIENTGVKCHFLGGYHVIRYIAGHDRCDYVVPRDILVSARSKLRLWAVGCLPSGHVKSVHDIETTLKSWGLGSHIVTKLEDQFGEEISTHIQARSAIIKTTENSDVDDH